jgi:hypothetical protein
MNNYLSIVKAIITKYNIDMDSSKKTYVYKLLCKYIDILVFNVVTIIAIITMINNSTSIHKEALNLLKSYIHQTCHKSKITTGGSLPSEYFGIDSGRYNENNYSGNILDINFESGTLRPQIGGGGSISKIDTKLIATNIKSIVKYYNLKISNEIIIELINIISENIDCLFRQLKTINSKYLNPSVIKKMIKSNKHLEIFK